MEKARACLRQVCGARQRDISPLPQRTADAARDAQLEDKTGVEEDDFDDFLRFKCDDLD